MILNIADILSERALEIERALEGCFDPSDTSTLTEAMRYALLGGGKRIRAFLTLSFAEMFGGCAEATMPYACAIEMVHAYSLIHDDLPCMDDDDMRRGKPSCHKKFGEAIALLAGDSLLTLAFRTVAANRTVSDRSVRRATEALSNLAGYHGMCRGQEIDILHEALSYDDLRKLHSLKTGALIEAACLLGVFAANDTPTEETLRRIKDYAQNLGLAFQIHDDILDVTSSTEELGKPVGSDERNDKRTVTSFMGLDAAMDEEYRVTRLAIDAVSEYPGSDVLSQLAIWLMSRKK